MTRKVDFTPVEQDTLAALHRGDDTGIARLAELLDAEDAARHARLTNPTALATAALWYAEAGIPVFPLQPCDKRPMPGTRGFKDATTDPATVRRWWKATPQANIGAPTGVVFDVVDLDGPQGAASFFGDPAAFAEVDPLIIGKVSTPRPGGLHLYISPQGNGNKAGMHPGVDYRGKGGYVVLPPSVTDTHGPGRRYTWLMPLELT